MKKLFYLLILIGIASCSTYNWKASYYSLRHLPEYERDEKATTKPKISLIMSIDRNHDITMTIFNHTDSTMTIDKTQSFFDNTPIYNPEVKVKTSSTYSSKGSSLNIGALSGALGLRGPLQGLLSGINVGKTNGVGSSVTTYDVDTPLVHIPPHGKITLNKEFDISWLENFSVCIAYSINRGKTFKNLTTAYGKYDRMSYKAPKKGRKYYFNEALRQLLLAKPDLMMEENFILYIDGLNAHPISKNILYDCQ